MWRGESLGINRFSSSWYVDTNLPNIRALEPTADNLVIDQVKLAFRDNSYSFAGNASLNNFLASGS